MNITVYCSSYNSLRFIDGYLKNINSQICEGFDLIFIDAESNDGSFEKIQNFKFNDSINVKIYQPGGRISIYDAWNYGVKKATTAYVMNFNTDDRLSPFALTAYQSYIEKFPAIDLFYGKHNFINDLQSPRPLPLTERWQNQIDSLLEKSEDKLMHTLNPCGPFPLVKRASLLKAGPFNDHYFSSGDYDMWLRMFSMGFKFKRIPETVGDFLYRPDSLSQSRLRECEEHDREIQSKYSKRIQRVP